VPSERELMEIHADVLFRHDGAGRMLDVNEPPYDEAPRLFLGAAKAGKVRRDQHGLGGRVVQELTDAGTELAGLIRVLARDRAVKCVDFGPTFLFPDVRHRNTKAIQINESNSHVLKPHFPYTFEELAEKQPCFAIVQDGAAVCVCRSARQTGSAAEASMDTLEPFRGRGYAVEVAEAWAAAVQRQGRIALYSTAWDNFASQAVARKLQLIQYGTEITID